MTYPDNLRYTQQHEWIEPLKDGTARVGITDYAQSALGDIVFVEMPSVDDEFEKGETFGVVESVKAVSDLYMPVACKIKEVNTELENQPDLLNQSPHDEGWIVIIEVTDEGELSALMTAEEYQDHLGTLAEGEEESAPAKAKKQKAKRTTSDDHDQDDDEDEDEEHEGLHEEYEEQSDDDSDQDHGRKH